MTALKIVILHRRFAGTFRFLCQGLKKFDPRTASEGGKVFGPTRTDDGYWRIKTDQEINDILKGQNIIGFIKKQRLKWLGHVERIAEDKIVQKIKRWKPKSKRPIERPKDYVLEDIKSINIGNWKKVAQNGERWKKVVEQTSTLYRL